MAQEDTIKIRPSDKFKEYVNTHFKGSADLPEGIKSMMDEDGSFRKRGGKSVVATLSDQLNDTLLTLQDVQWLRSHVQKLRLNGDDSSAINLHKLLEGCDIVLPEPPVVERNPILEARVQRLRKEQEAREYRAMTKNVDNTRARTADESIGSQMKMMNQHLIAVLSFVISVGAGFTFGFLGIELMVGNLEFGFRLLLGVACALTIALAEIYFLAKKLSEDYDDAPSIYHQPQRVTNFTTVTSKQHTD